MRNLCAILSVCILLGYGCTSSLELQRPPVALRASSGDILIDSEPYTKSASAEPFMGTPSANNILDAALWFSFKAGEYSHNPTVQQNLPCATTVRYSSSARTDIRCNDQLILYPIAADSNYSEVGDDVYCVGFHPSTGWGTLSTATVTSASHEINGSEDLMFADQMTGSYSENFGTQTFRHLLTWVKINMNAASLKDADTWGEIESLEIVSPNNTVSIAFSGELQEGKPEASTVSYSGGIRELSLDLPDNKSLSITTKMFGNVFCAPPASHSGKYGYTVRVKTANIPMKEVFVELKKEDNVTPVDSADYAVGKLFVITLHFKELAVVEGVCTLRQWDDQSSDIYLQ